MLQTDRATFRCTFSLRTQRSWEIYFRTILNFSDVAKTLDTCVDCAQQNLRNGRYVDILHFLPCRIVDVEFRTEVAEQRSEQTQHIAGNELKSKQCKQTNMKLHNETANR